ncbi:sialate O-acetylesterase [Hymenobacter bucti]|uniref:Sialate O-acetylesterase n=1 Tax=Hymenobacter bucti TaxID=1844114 RepID=A0ABW4R184_9BACT
MVPHAALVSSEGLADKGDKLHFDAASASELGRHYATPMLALQRAAAPKRGKRTGDPCGQTAFHELPLRNE